MKKKSIITLSRFQVDVSRSLAKRGKKLLEAANIHELIQELEPLEVYFIIKELGLPNAGPLLKHVTPEQFQTFADLECWEDDHFDVKAMDAWLAPFAEEGPSALIRAFTSLDSELQILFIARSLIIHDIHHEAIPDIHDGEERMTTSDGFFLLETVDLEKKEIHPFYLIEACYSTDMKEAFKLIMAARWELPTPLEEEAYHFRNGRMEELGFPDLREAMSIFSPPPEKPPKKDEVRKAFTYRTTLPALYAEHLKRDCLLVRVISQITDRTSLDVIETELANLIGAAIIAYRESPRDILHVVELAERVRDTVSLGLEQMLAAEGRSDRATEEAAKLLQSCPLSFLFRYGYRAAAVLKKQALLLTSDPVVEHWLEKEEQEKEQYSQDRLDREFLRALIAERPLYGGFDPVKPERRKAFGAIAEIHESQRRLERISDRVT